MRKVVEEYIMLEDDFNAKVEEKVQEERRVITTLKERGEGQKQATEQARDDLMKMADDKADIERQLSDREHQCKLYEQKHGLEEAVAHQKELKLEIRRRDRELSKINHKLSEQLEANGKFEMFCHPCIGLFIQILPFQLFHSSFFSF